MTYQLGNAIDKFLIEEENAKRLKELRTPRKTQSHHLSIQVVLILL